MQVIASAEEKHHTALGEYSEWLYMVMEVVPDPPELKELMDQLDALAAKEGDSTIEATIEWAKKHYPDDPLIILQTEMTSAGSSVMWAAKWSKLSKAGEYEVWHGPKYVKMRVKIGGAYLRGVTPATTNKYAGGETAWTVADSRCSVHALSRCEYQLPATWHTEESIVTSPRVRIPRPLPHREPAGTLRLLAPMSRFIGHHVLTVRTPTLAGLGVRMRVARSRTLVAQGRPAAVVARVARISRQAIYRRPKRPPAGQRRPLYQVDRVVLAVARANPIDGTPRVATLAGRELGGTVNRKRVQGSCTSTGSCSAAAQRAGAGGRVLPR